MNPNHDHGAGVMRSMVIMSIVLGVLWWTTIGFFWSWSEGDNTGLFFFGLTMAVSVGSLFINNIGAYWEAN